ncbi:hypothetical protein ACFQHO_03050 [Actinomadura yumaensis]|uniref:hypothetical protein n=1 Tax=Actinomadura yumaensis TaxID=111807 RepID=UPI00360ADD4C
MAEHADLRQVEAPAHPARQPAVLRVGVAPGVQRGQLVQDEPRVVHAHAQGPRVVAGDGLGGVRPRSTRPPGNSTIPDSWVWSMVTTT